MIQEIKKNLFLIKVPLPNNPLKNLNSYFIKGKKRNLLVDTGFNHQACYNALKTGLEEIQADLSNTDIFVTHLHSDHAGLSAKMAEPESKIYMSQVDASYIKTYFDLDYFENLESIFYSLGFSKKEFADNMKNSPIIQYAPPYDTRYQYVYDKDVIDLGDRQLLAIATPGHTPGHMCLYLPDEKLLLSGDHIIFDITPNITKWPGFENALGGYLESLKKIRQLPVEMTLSAHRNPMGNCNDRIDQLLKHHAVRLKEAFEIVKNQEGLTPYEIAAQMTWSIRAKDWQSFPVVQKWFATGEASSHLEYLEHQGKIVCRYEDKTFRYYLK
jgi:glyoxylase-like metal-dependent hydrolase (beta-lactamase superfamily II)